MPGCALLAPRRADLARGAPTLLTDRHACRERSAIRSNA
ncbi:hypothetical protein BURPS668_A1190 [Burkholderia pseudomallei 668]|nr:hypothetical protein BURPS668_A1190 [Burkholderia pseudomallei 668]